MHTLSFSDSTLTRACSLCAVCKLALGLQFAGLRLQPGVTASPTQTDPDRLTATSIVCGAGLPERIDHTNVVEYPLCSADGRAIGTFFIGPADHDAAPGMVQSFVDSLQALFAESSVMCQGDVAPSMAPGGFRGANSEIFSLSADAFCIAGFDGNFKYVNAAFAEILGQSEERLREHSFLALVHPDDRGVTLDIMRTVLAKGAIRNFRNRFLCHGSEYRSLEWSAVYVPGEELMYASARDITDLLRAEKSYRDTNALLQTLNRALLDYIGPESKNSPFDVMLEELLRLSNSEYGFIGEVLHDAHGQPYLKSHALSNIAWDESTRALYENARLNGMEFRNLQTLFGRVLTSGKPVFANTPKTDARSGGLPHGHPPMHAFLGVPIYSADRLVGMIGIANRPGGYDESTLASLELFVATCSTLILAFRADSARIEMERRLRREEQRRRAIVDTALDSIIVLSPSGRIDSVNPATCEMFGLPVEALQGESFCSLLQSDSRAPVQAYLENLTRQPGAPFRQELLALTADGRELTLDVALSANAFDTETLIVGVLRDITRLKHAERELCAAMQAAERASRAKSDFLAHMSHELRTPINGVIGMLELGQQSLHAEEQREYLLTAANCADQMLLLVNDLLDFAKIEAGQLLLEESTLQLRSLLGNLTQEPIMRAARKGLTLDVAIDAEVPDVVTGDATRLGQVLLNLLSNAIKFTDRGGIVLRVTRESRIRDTALVRFEVEDTGIGINESQQAHIFDAFMQADASITRRFGGTGLGLSISSQLVQLMGGTLSVQSQPGKGSCFAFTLALRCLRKPASRSAVATDARASNVPQVATTPLRVLLAEDNLVNQKLISTVLHRRGHQVALAEDGSSAVALAAVQEFDVILMDLQMPVLDGLQATRIIRWLHDNAAHRPRIIALTAHALQSDAIRCREAGMDGYLAKPMKMQDLIGVVEGVHAGPGGPPAHE